MLKFVMVEETDEIVIYNYYPEGKSVYGTISFNKKTKECKIIKLSEEETDYFTWYARHMFSRCRKFHDEGQYEKEGMVAWY